LNLPYQVDANDDVYTVVDAETTVYWAVITGAATDEIFPTLNAPGFTVELARTDLGTKAFQNGLYAITGYPTQSFPKLSSTNYTVSYILSAPGYRDFPMTVTIPANSTFPVTAPAAALRLLPVRIQGRVVSAASRAPISGASIVSVDNPATPPTVHTTALRAPCYFAHAGGAAAQEVTTASTGSATLTQDVGGGAQVLNLSVRTGLVAGSIVSLNNSAGVRLEYGVVESLGPGADTSPGQVFLSNALNYSYPMATTAVSFVSITPSGAAATLKADVDAGDGVLLASQLFTQTVALESGGPLAEVHEVGALSGADGYYVLDGIGRVQDIFLQGTPSASPVIVDWFVEYDQAFNVVDFRL
jgi:hypothetical protein